MKMSKIAMKIITDTAIEKIATTQGATIEEVKAAIEQGNEVACQMFQKLFLVGVKQVASL